MLERIRNRYMAYYITDAQLERYCKLGVITEEQMTELKAERENVFGK